MHNVIKFPVSNAKFDRMEWLLENISCSGFEASIIRNGHNWRGDLSFSLNGEPFNGDALTWMTEARDLFNKDENLRREMYAFFFSIGALYYEGSTSSALSFLENRMPEAAQ